MNIANSTNVEPLFRSEINQRGTFSLVWSCLATFILCVWTAVHPNIIPNKTGWRIHIYKLTMMLIAALLPESIALYAYIQMREAKRLQKIWCEYFDIEPGSDEDRMGMEGGYFVVMGGLIVDENTDTGSITTLTPLGFEGYTQAGRIHRNAFDKKHIIDKGKASAVTKALVFFQAAWFITQFITRILDGLPLTLIEIHVLIQVAFTVTAYGFWWYKPLDVGEALKIEMLRPPEPASPWDNYETTFPPVDTKEYPPNPYFITERPRTHSLPLAVKAWHDVAGEPLRTKMFFTAAVAAAANGIFHALAWNSLFPTVLECLLWRISSLISTCAMPLCMAMIKISNISHDILREFWEMSFVDANMLTHLRIVLRRYYKAVDKVSRRFSKGMSLLKYIVGISMVILSGFLAWAYFLSFIFILVESLISVRSLPKGSYTTPKWSNYFPHI